MNEARDGAFPRFKLPPGTLLVGLLALAYALPGLFGHAPWKPEDAIGAKARPFTGAEYLASLRDGREVYIYGERVADGRQEVLDVSIADAGGGHVAHRFLGVREWQTFDPQGNV